MQRIHSKGRGIVLCFVMVVLVPGVLFGAGMGDLMQPVTIAGDSFFEWFPAGAYNSVQNEFVFFYRISGFLDPEQVGEWMSGLNGRRVSYAGEGLGDPIASISPLGTELQAWAKPAYNPLKDQYMVSFVREQPDTGWDVFAVILDSQGNNLSGTIPVSVIPGQAQHPFIVFNPVRKVYFITWDDNRVQGNNIYGIMLDQEGNIATGEFVISDAAGDQIFTDMSINTRDGSCLVTWEDFRRRKSWLGDGDIFGALVDAGGDIIKNDIAVCDDYGRENEGDQRQQHQTYNSSADNFFVVWWDERPTTLDGAIYARIVGSDGELSGDDFLLVDEPNPQVFCSVCYHEGTNRIFAVWDDMRDAVPDAEDEKMQERKDIYARWFTPDGRPDGPEIPIEIHEGQQRNPKMVYNPLNDTFMIAWRNYDVDEEGGGGAPIGGGHIQELPGDIDGMLYGRLSLLTARVVDSDSAAPLEGARVLVMGMGSVTTETANEGGWVNVAEPGRAGGLYLVMAHHQGYRRYVALAGYDGERIDMTIRLTARDMQ